MNVVPLASRLFADAHQLTSNIRVVDASVNAAQRAAEAADPSPTPHTMVSTRDHTIRALGATVENAALEMRRVLEQSHLGRRGLGVEQAEKALKMFEYQARQLATRPRIDIDAANHRLRDAARLWNHSDEDASHLERPFQTVMRRAATWDGKLGKMTGAELRSAIRHMERVADLAAEASADTAGAIETIRSIARTKRQFVTRQQLDGRALRLLERARQRTDQAANAVEGMPSRQGSSAVNALMDSLKLISALKAQTFTASPSDLIDVQALHIDGARVENLSQYALRAAEQELADLKSAATLLQRFRRGLPKDEYHTG